MSNKIPQGRTPRGSLLNNNGGTTKPKGGSRKSSFNEFPKSRDSKIDVGKIAESSVKNGVETTARAAVEDAVGPGANQGIDGVIEMSKAADDEQFDKARGKASAGGIKLTATYLSGGTAKPIIDVIDKVVPEDIQGEYANKEVDRIPVGRNFMKAVKKVSAPIRESNAQAQAEQSNSSSERPETRGNATGGSSSNSDSKMSPAANKAVDKGIDAGLDKVAATVGKAGLKGKLASAALKNDAVRSTIKNVAGEKLNQGAGEQPGEGLAGKGIANDSSNVIRSARSAMNSVDDGLDSPIRSSSDAVDKSLSDKNPNEEGLDDADKGSGINQKPAETSNKDSKRGALRNRSMLASPMSGGLSDSRKKSPGLGLPLGLATAPIKLALLPIALPIFIILLLLMLFFGGVVLGLSSGEDTVIEQKKQFIPTVNVTAPCEVLKSNNATENSAGGAGATAGTVGNSAAAQLAMLAASYSYSRPSFNGEGYTGTQAYKDMASKVISGYNTDFDKTGTILSCDRGVCVAVRGGGFDEHFPQPCSSMMDYCNKHPEIWQACGEWDGTEESLQPGDILIRYGTSRRHVCMFVGKEIVKAAYEQKIKGTDGDRGEPSEDSTWVSARRSRDDYKHAAPACIGPGDGYAHPSSPDMTTYVFRYIGSGGNSDAQASTSGTSTETSSPASTSSASSTPSGSKWEGDALSPSSGVADGPSGHETFYDPTACSPPGTAESIIDNAKRDGVTEVGGKSIDDCPPVARDDGAWTVGGYVIAACDLSYKPRGSIIATTMGPAIVLDTGPAYGTVDICVNWGGGSNAPADTKQDTGKKVCSNRKTGTATVAASSSGSGSDFSDTLLIGDSITADSSPVHQALKDTLPGITINSQPGRAYDTQTNGYSDPVAIDYAKEHAKDYKRVIIEIGTNIGLDKEQCKNFIDTAPNSSFWFVNIYDSRNSHDDSTNAAIKEACSEYGATLIDWNSVAKEHSEYLADVCHPSSEGAQPYADLVKAGLGHTSTSTTKSGGDEDCVEDPCNIEEFTEDNTGGGASTPFSGDWVFWDQSAPNWPNASGTWTSGCGVVSISMVLCSYAKDTQYTPNWMEGAGLAIPGDQTFSQGTVCSYVNEHQDIFHLKASEDTGKGTTWQSNWDQVEKICKNGGCVIVGESGLASSNAGASCGHFVVVVKIEGEDVYYADPWGNGQYGDGSGDHMCKGTVSEFKSLGHNFHATTQTFWFEKI